MPYDTEMRGRGRLADLPPLSPHQEKNLRRAIMLSRLPEDGGLIDKCEWFALIRRDLTELEATSGSYWSYSVFDGEELLTEAREMCVAGYCARDNGNNYCRLAKTRTFFKRLNVNALAWVARLKELTVLDTLAGL